MKTNTIKLKNAPPVQVTRVHTLVIGSGAAGLSAAIQLRCQGIEDVLIVTEGLKMGTSINTGSDKQTYYKSAICGDEPDSPVMMAKTYFDQGSMHGDVALVEAAVSGRAFFNLVNLGVKFPQDPYGQFVGYKTDHDPRQRATSVGPYTSRDMCLALIADAARRRIPVHEKIYVVSLLASDSGGKKRACGALALNASGDLVAYAADNVIFAVGGPGGLYKTSVYPVVHTGAIGVGLKAGAVAQNLPESQYGLASVKFRWNVSGSYMQVLPRFISTDPDGKSHSREFLKDYFPDTGQMNDMIFLKGYQWPFDTKKMAEGSSIIDILVFIETVLNNRRVFLDFRRSTKGFRLTHLAKEGYEYLKKSAALQKTPIERLSHMNPGAVELYRKNGIDLAGDMLEIAVCAQHNNGGLAGNHWWESTNIEHLFPIGEVNGSHGVARPGGSALNAGQVGAIRAAEYIGNCYRKSNLKMGEFRKVLEGQVSDTTLFLKRCQTSKTGWQSVRKEFQERMSRSGAHIRSLESLEQAAEGAETQVKALEKTGCTVRNPRMKIQALRTRQLCFAHWIYLSAALYQVKSGVGSRGSAMVRDPSGQPISRQLDQTLWRCQPENASFRGKVLETVFAGGKIRHRWVKCRAIPDNDLWFETVWADFRKGNIYR